MKKILMLGVVLCTVNGFAQDKSVKELKADAEKKLALNPADTATKRRQIGANFSLDVNQGSLSNWSAGGDKFSFSLNSFLTSYALFKSGRNEWDNNLDLGYGVLKTSSLGSRKSNDRLEFNSKYGYAIGPKVNLAALVNVRSQFSKGYAYLKNAAGADSASLTSKSFEPTYLLLSLGIDYKPARGLSLFISPVTGRLVIAPDPEIGALYGVAPGESTKKEFGAYAAINYLRNFSNNVLYKGELDLFSNYERKPGNVDIFFTNRLSAKVGRYVHFSVNFDVIYDDDTHNVDPTKGPAPQVSEQIGVGLNYSFHAK